MISEITRKKLSDSKMGAKNPMYGRSLNALQLEIFAKGRKANKWTPERRLAQSLRMSGDNNPMRDPKIAAQVGETNRRSGVFAGKNNPSCKPKEREQRLIVRKKWWESLSKEEKATVVRRLSEGGTLPRSKETAHKVSMTWKNKPEEERKRIAAHHGAKMREFYASSRGDIWKANHSKLLSGENGPNWQGGIAYLPYSFDFNYETKEKIAKRDNYTCQFCGGSHKVVRANMVHHIDYNKKNTKPRNLILLCNSCNSRANFDRDKWQFLFEVLQELRGI